MDIIQTQVLKPLKESWPALSAGGVNMNIHANIRIGDGYFTNI